jgi:RNA polymerase sigma-70 factor (ECF subfamily)
MRDAGPSDLLAHAAWLRRLAFALLGPSPAVDDLIQETWAAAMAAPPSQHGSLRPWLRVVLQNLAHLHLRGEQRRQAREQVAGALAGRLPSAEDLLSRHQSLTELARVVSALEEPYRSTVLLCYGEELTPSEIARREGIPAGTVRWRLKQGLDRLRAEMDRAHGSRRAWVGLVSPAHEWKLFSSGALGMKIGGKGAAGVILVLILVLTAAVMVRRKGSRLLEANGFTSAGPNAGPTTSKDATQGIRARAKPPRFVGSVEPPPDEPSSSAGRAPAPKRPPAAIRCTSCRTAATSATAWTCRSASWGCRPRTDRSRRWKRCLGGSPT